jgi:hypothetical protein
VSTLEGITSLTKHRWHNAIHRWIDPAVGLFSPRLKGAQGVPEGRQSIARPIAVVANTMLIVLGDQIGRVWIPELL